MVPAACSGRRSSRHILPCMEFGTESLGDLAARLGASPTYVRAAFDRAGDELTLRTAYVVIGAQPPRWREDRWRYQDLLLAAGEMPAETFLAAFDGDGEGVLRVGKVAARVPPAQMQAHWRHKPSRAQHDASPLPWPTFDYELSQRDVNTPTSQSGFQIGEDCPSFPDAATAIRAFFHGDFSTFGAQATNAHPLAVVRVAQVEAWIERVRVTPTHVDVLVRGDRPAGARLEINGSALQATKTVGRSGRVRIALPNGLPDDAWLYLSRGLAWLDYRVLGPRLPGASDLAALGVDIELPVDPEGRARALIAQGEGPRVEFKRNLPDTGSGAPRNVMKTVAAFASGDGGELLFGIEPDEVTVVGLGPGIDLRGRDQLGDLVRRYVVPTPEFEAHSVAVDGKTVIVLSVRRGEYPPYGYLSEPDRGIEYFVRRGASTFPAAQAEVRASVLASIPPPSPPSRLGFR